MDEIERIERRLKLHDVRVLLSVAHAGSMGKAAELLRTSQSAISRSIANMEHALGVRLLDRSKEGIEPTQYGRAIIKRGVAVFDELRQGIKDVEFLADPTAGELRLACAESMATGLVFATIERLNQRYPHAAFHVVAGGGPPLLTEVENRNVEFAISRMTMEIASEHFVTQTLFDDSYVIVAGSESPWTRRRRIELAELLNESWILPPPDNFGTMLIAEAFHARGLKPPRPAVVTLSLNLRNRFLATGRFLTMLPGYSVRFPDGGPPLRALPVKLPDRRAPVTVVTLRNRTLSPLGQRFIETLRGIAQSMKEPRPNK
jgi:DNA-binding transcriptional LysR family regulator